MAPVEYEPNPLELETLELANRVIAERLESHLGEDEEAPVIKRDPELSRQAQLGAELLIPKFAQYIDPDNAQWDDPTYSFRPHILDDKAPHQEAYVCGPAPLTQEQIEQAYRRNGSPYDLPVDGIVGITGALLSFQKPLGGVGYAESQGLACSYMLLTSEIYPFR